MTKIDKMTNTKQVLSLFLFFFTFTFNGDLPPFLILFNKAFKFYRYDPKKKLKEKKNRSDKKENFFFGLICFDYFAYSHLE